MSKSRGTATQRRFFSAGFRTIGYHVCLGRAELLINSGRTTQ